MTWTDAHTCRNIIRHPDHGYTLEANARCQHPLNPAPGDVNGFKTPSVHGRILFRHPQQRSQA